MRNEDWIFLDARRQQCPVLKNLCQADCGDELFHLKQGEVGHNAVVQFLDVVEKFNHMNVSPAQPVPNKVVLPVALQHLWNLENQPMNISSQAGTRVLP